MTTALAKDPEHRFSTARAFREALERAVPPARTLPRGIAAGPTPGPPGPESLSAAGGRALGLALLTLVVCAAITVRFAGPRALPVARTSPVSARPAASPDLVRRTGSDS